GTACTPHHTSSSSSSGSNGVSSSGATSASSGTTSSSSGVASSSGGTSSGASHSTASSSSSAGGPSSSSSGSGASSGVIPRAVSVARATEIPACSVFVDAASTGTMDGTSAHPFATIGAAVNNAMTDAVICVAQGVYPEMLSPGTTPFTLA